VDLPRWPTRKKRRINMEIGPIELALVLLVAGCVVLAVAVTKRRWLLGLPAFFVVGMICSPADPASTLLIAVPCCCIYAFALWRTRPASGCP
jgi:Sec-independent protein secretion pathway component TatC